mmetsp:Transcript_7551/g.18113  ORF Transcript_7551/g.18113 Transcript_7551/m.18113 type:complete len:103 (-) Transcript_7551:167-475(-)
MEFLCHILVHHLYQRLVVWRSIRHNPEWPQLQIGLYDGVLKCPADQALCIENRVGRVARYLVLGGVSQQSFFVCPGDVRGRRPVALVIRNDLHLSILEDTNT